MKAEKFILFLLFCLFTTALEAQTYQLYNYGSLSHLFYEKQKDSLKKVWVCPAVYKEKKTQKQYKEIWDGRTDFLLDAIKNDSYLHDEDVYRYVDNILDQIAKANRSIIPEKPFLLIDRSASINAYAIGSNVLAVNLGLIVFARCREELALAIAHELSHNILKHPEQSMQQRSERLSSDEYKQSINAVLDAKYERLSKLKQVLETYAFDRVKHQRYHESDADSLAIILLKQSNISFDAAFFLRLDSADMVYHQPLKQPLKNYFSGYNLPFEDMWTHKRSKGLSTKTYSFKDNTDMQDSLKTHPDCADRYDRTKRFSNAQSTEPIPAGIHDKANKMLIWNMYNNSNLTQCLYRVLLQKDAGGTDEWYDFMVHNIFTSLFYADKQLRRFAAIGIISKEYISKDYYDLQTMLEQMPREYLEEYCKKIQSAGFWSRLSPAERNLKSFLYTLALDADNSDKNISKAAKEYRINNSSSMYCELSGVFEK